MNEIIKTSWLCNNLENNMNHLLNGFLILYVCVYNTESVDSVATRDLKNHLVQAPY